MSCVKTNFPLARYVLTSVHMCALCKRGGVNVCVAKLRMLILDISTEEKKVDREREVVGGLGSF